MRRRRINHPSRRKAAGKFLNFLVLNNVTANANATLFIPQIPPELSRDTRRGSSGILFFFCLTIHTHGLFQKWFSFPARTVYSCAVTGQSVSFALHCFKAYKNSVKTLSNYENLDIDFLNGI